MDEFPERLKKLCEEKKKKGVTRYVICDLCELDRNAIKRYVDGTSEPRLSSAKKLATYFGVSLDYLAGLSEKP